MKKVISIMIGFLLTNCLVWAEESPPNALTILKKTKEIIEPQHPSIRKIDMTLKEHGKEEAKKVMGQAFKEFPDGKKMLLVMLEPPDVKGMGFLLIDRPKVDNVMYAYIPAMRRTKKIEGITGKYSSFFGTDFTFADLDFINLKGNYKFLGEEKQEGIPAYKIEEDPLNVQFDYSKIIIWVAKDSLLPIRREFYDPSGALWKVELFKDIKILDGMPTAMKITMKDFHVDTVTELDMHDLQYCGTLSDNLFNPNNLDNVSNDPIWQPYCTKPIEKK